MHSIITPAFMTPVQSSHSRRQGLGIARPTDRFWLVERNFTDRSGWEDAAPVDQPIPEVEQVHHIILPQNGPVVTDDIDIDTIETSSSEDGDS